MHEIGPEAIRRASDFSDCGVKPGLGRGRDAESRLASDDLTIDI